MTKKVNFIEIMAGEEIEIHAIIENADGSFTSMLKSTYDAIIADE
jgi:hypothetical protein